ncbi:hypothetical protein JDV02_006917 [Purpureocillium takamizusanense]|uniref:Uncharacterized protein n=1 Tax=Purpureocillium takamizusanense TaxID=2060973 RepID=A0A9Q8VCN6_9HYPO|nr:uncharacterized protein JDV02_006917 [Purpureocillium takamizusanense]UNI20868.1 hypothetical protein JDV02_006917 [Purpureocillium takamizusanense]
MDEAPTQSSRSPVSALGHSQPVSAAPLIAAAPQIPPAPPSAPVLVDIEDSDEESGEENPYATIEEAAEKLCTLMDSLQGDFVGKGFPLTGAAVDELQDAAIDIWLQRGFLDAEDDDIKEDMVNLLKSLFQVKRQAIQFRHKFKNSRVLRSASAKAAESSSLKSLQELQLGPTPRGRIQYTSEQLSQLAAGAMPRPKDLDQADYLPAPGKRAKISQTPKIDGLAQVRKWLDNGKRHAPAGAQVLVSSSAASASFSIPATTAAMPAVTMPGPLTALSETSCEAMELDSLPPTPASRWGVPSGQGASGYQQAAKPYASSISGTNKSSEPAATRTAVQLNPVAKGLANSLWAN